jgi:acyl carrier protein
MQRIDFVEQIRARMADIFEVDQDSVSEESRLVEDLDADSIDVLELILSLKDDFGITVHDGEVKVLLTELAQFLPDGHTFEGDLSDAQLQEINRRLTVNTIVDFVEARVGATQ